MVRRSFHTCLGGIRHSGAPDEHWNNDALVRELAQVHGSAFEDVRMNGLVAG